MPLHYSHFEDKGEFDLEFVRITGCHFKCQMQLTLQILHKKGKVQTKRVAAVIFPHAPPVALPAITALPFPWDREPDGRLENLIALAFLLSSS